MCNSRVDHSVIHYWEKNIARDVIEEIIRVFGSLLEELLSYSISIIDATSFANWYNETMSFHLLVRVSKSVYPVSITRDNFNPITDVRNVIIPGNGFLLADKWYDVNEVYRIIYEHGYIPLICPQRTRCSGYWRRKARKIYHREWRRYRQRGRGESVFGSITNWFGDRLHTRKESTTYFRICVRILCYQIRILIRIKYDGNDICWLIIIFRLII